MFAMDRVPRRYYVIPPPGSPAADVTPGFDVLEGAATAALAFGEGTEVIDTLANLYQPMVQQVQGGALVSLGFGGWGAKVGLSMSLIEAVRKGHPPLVRAFLAKGADANVADDHGGTALIWAVAVNKPEIAKLLLAAGADPAKADDEGTTPLALAERKGRGALVEMLRAAGG